MAWVESLARNACWDFNNGLCKVHFHQSWFPLVKKAPVVFFLRRNGQPWANRQTDGNLFYVLFSGRDYAVTGIDSW